MSALLPASAGRPARPARACACSPRDIAGRRGGGGRAATAFTDFRIRAERLQPDAGAGPRHDAAGRPGGWCSAAGDRHLPHDGAAGAAGGARARPLSSPRCEQELAQITAAMVTAGERDEPELLDRLTRLAAEIDSRQADNAVPLQRRGRLLRAGAAAHRRTARDRHRGLQTLREFTERRLAPAMNTCRASPRGRRSCPAAWRGRRSCWRPGSA